jgi:hypothetical protein
MVPSYMALLTYLWHQWDSNRDVSVYGRYHPIPAGVRYLLAASRLGLKGGHPGASHGWGRPQLNNPYVTSLTLTSLGCTYHTANPCCVNELLPFAVLCCTEAIPGQQEYQVPVAGAVQGPQH